MHSLKPKTQIKTELLSPAGSFDCARAAVNAGADAIYMGGPFFSARAYAESSNEDMLLKTLDFCHLRGVRVFMTLNTLLKETELATVRDYLKPYVDKGLDGVIVQDLGVMRLVREYYPSLELHVSTQMAVTGVRTARRLMELGAKRIVLARELSLSEIAEIYKQTGAELEVFAHGALCYSYSGNCLMSSFIGGRSGNRGRCAGTCRLPFDAYDEADKRLNRKNEQYLLSMCDLNTLHRVPEMIKAGVYSFKIEGRMKSPEYTAAVTSVYRKYLDKAMEYVKADSVKPKQAEKKVFTVNSEDERLLTEVFDRAGVTSAYLDGGNGRDMVTLAGKPEYRDRDESLIADIRARYIEKDIKLPIYAKVKLYKDEPIELEYSYGGTKVKFKSQMTVQKADKRPTSLEEVADKIGRLGDTDFVLDDCEIELGDDCFVPMRALNELRREAADELARRILSYYIRDNGLACTDNEADNAEVKLRVSSDSRKGLHLHATIRATVETAEQFKVCLDAADLIYIDSAFFEPQDYRYYVQQAHEAGKLIGLRLPYIWRDKAEKYFDEHAGNVREAGFDTYLFRNTESLLYFYEKGLLDETKFATDSSMYTFNPEARAELTELIPEAIRANYISACLPLELNGRELEALIAANKNEEETLPCSELTVYGRAPMMVSAQCINKTVNGCDRRTKCLKLRDRKGAEMPVKNVCRFCYNEIYNSVPTMLYDMQDTLARIAADALRYDFTTETAQEVRQILAGVPLMAGAFTRGHLKRGV